MPLTPTTKLEAVNELLEAIGESPVNSLSNTGLIEADLAVKRIDMVSREVQAKGWHWNTLVNYVVEPDTSGHIILPLSTLKVDTVGRSASIDVVQRGSKLYDMDNNTLNIGKAVTVDLVLFLDFEELPESARNYIKIRAARKFQQKVFGSPELSQYDREDEQQAYFDLLDTESETRDMNMLRDSRSVHRIINRKYFHKD